MNNYTNPENALFDISPKVVRLHKQQVITISPAEDITVLPPSEDIEILWYPREQLPENYLQNGKNIVSFLLKNKTLKFDFIFEEEQEYFFQITNKKYNTCICALCIYALEDDLYFRLPFKGDFHIHSSCSDGQEQPAYVAAAVRKIGLDFMAITDHGLYQPSIEAQQAFSELPMDLRIFRGEEIHPPENSVHMVNFGGNLSINELFKTGHYKNGLSKILTGLNNKNSLNTLEKKQLASCIWCFKKIREAGGLGILCHSYWITGSRYNVSRNLINEIFKSDHFDAYEILSGYHKYELDSNTLQVARYHEARAQGINLPIVGVSDAHSCNKNLLFGWNYSIVFSPTSGLSDIISNVRNFYSVAVEAVPGETIRIHGPFRLVSYALFLTREVFPEHDRLCHSEGDLLLQYLGDYNFTTKDIPHLPDQTAKFYKHMGYR